MIFCKDDRQMKTKKLNCSDYEISMGEDMLFASREMNSSL